MNILVLDLLLTVLSSSRLAILLLLLFLLFLLADVPTASTSLVQQNRLGRARRGDALRGVDTKRDEEDEDSNDDAKVSPYMRLVERQGRLHPRGTAQSRVARLRASDGACGRTVLILGRTVRRELRRFTLDLEVVKLVRGERFDGIVDWVDPSDPGEPGFHLWRVDHVACVSVHVRDSEGRTYRHK